MRHLMTTFFSESKTKWKSFWELNFCQLWERSCFLAGCVCILRDSCSMLGLKGRVDLTLPPHEEGLKDSARGHWLQHAEIMSPGKFFPWICSHPPVSRPSQNNQPDLRSAHIWQLVGVLEWFMDRQRPRRCRTWGHAASSWLIIFSAVTGSRPVRPPHTSSCSSAHVWRDYINLWHRSLSTCWFSFLLSFFFLYLYKQLNWHIFTELAPNILGNPQCHRILLDAALLS